MKKITILIFLIIISCKKELTSEEKKSFNDSITKYENKIDSLKFLNSKLPDSIINTEQKKVIDKIYFGASEKATKSNIAIFIKRSEIKKGNPYMDYYIGDYQFNEFRVDGYYHKDKLYRLNIKGYPISYKNYNAELKSQIENLNDVLKSKYGNSTNSFPLLESFEMNDEFTYLLYQWIIGEKTIEIRLEPNKTFYYVNLEIYQPEIEKQVIKNVKNKNKDSNTKGGEIL